MVKANGDESVDARVLWNDFCIYISISHIETLHLNEEKQESYYNTLMEKVFKCEGFTIRTRHYDSITNNNSYLRYFSDCFEIVKEKQFWKWIGKLGKKDKETLVSIVETYEQLSVLLGYYLYFMSRPHGDEWMRRLEIEKKALERIKEEYRKDRWMEPVISKLKNPLYSSNGNLNGDIRKQVTDYGNASQQFGHHQFDRTRFTELIQGQNLMDSVGALELIRNCKPPKKMDEVFEDLISKIRILQDTILKFDGVYQADLFQLKEYYIVEALQLSASYLEYLDVGVELKVLNETENNVYDAVQTLIVAVEDKINEIYLYGSMELKARSKALEALMNQDGHIKSAYKLNTNREE